MRFSLERANITAGIDKVHAPNRHRDLERVRCCAGALVRCR
jgi:hypothetical protein